MKSSLLALASIGLADQTAQASVFGDAIGDAYTGAMLATQANMYNTDTDCYAAAEEANVEIAYTFDTFDPSIIINNFSVLQIKMQTTLESCNLQSML